MDYNILLDTATELGYRLAMSGAETFRVEDSIVRILAAYGMNAEVFAIPNYLIVSFKTNDSQPMTRMRRIGHHGNDLDAVERYNALCRRICDECPDPKVLQHWLLSVDQSKRQYHIALHLFGHILGALGFAILFGGSFADSVCSGACGLIIGIVNLFMDKHSVNQFFKIISAAFLMALAAYFLRILGIADNADMVIIGALMIQVPGLLFTNAMRDIIYGDTNSGINRIVQVFLIAIAIALGTGAALGLSGKLFGHAVSPAPLVHSLWLQCLACFIGCVGFSIQFNIHGRFVSLYAIGGVLAWVVYCFILQYFEGDLLAYFAATIAAALYSEILARIRKCPAISFLVVAIFPLIPGAGVYYTMNYALVGDMVSFASKGMHTISVAGVMAVGILLASTIVRLIDAVCRRRLSLSDII